MGTLTVVGFGLAILFVAVSGVLGNSLRHRNDELEAAKLSSEDFEKAWDNERTAHATTKAQLRDSHGLLGVRGEQLTRLEDKIQQLKTYEESQRTELKKAISDKDSTEENLTAALNELKAVREAQAENQLKAAAQAATKPAPAATPTPTASAKPKRRYKKRS